MGSSLSTLELLFATFSARGGHCVEKVEVSFDVPSVTKYHVVNIMFHDDNMMKHDDGRSAKT